MADKPKRRWYQFSLKWIFVVTAIVAGIAWAIPAALERMNGWPVLISGIGFENYSNETVKDVQITGSDGTVLWDSKPFWKFIPHNVGETRKWDNPNERPRIGRRLMFRWTDSKGVRRSFTKTLDADGLDYEGRVLVFQLAPDGTVR